MTNVVVPVPATGAAYAPCMSDTPPPNWGGPPPPPNQPPPPPGYGQSQGQGPYPSNYGQQPPPPPYGYQQYGGVSQAQHPQGTTILVLGILGLVVCSPLGIAAWVMGNKAMREINADPNTTYTNRGQVNAGRICGIVATCLLILGLVIVVIAAIAGS